MGVVFVLGGFRKCKPFGLSRCFFLQAVLGSCGAVCFVMGRVFPRGSCTQLCLLFGAVFVSASRLVCRGVFFCKRYLFLAGRFVLSGGALYGFLRGRLVCRGVFFCKRFWVRAGRFVLSGDALHGFFLRKLVGLGCCLLSIFIFKTQSVDRNARIACKTIKSTHSHGI